MKRAGSIARSDGIVRQKWNVVGNVGGATLPSRYAGCGSPIASAMRTIAPFSTSNVIGSDASPTAMLSLVTGHRLLRVTEKRIDIRWRDLDAFGHVNQAVYQT